MKTKAEAYFCKRAPVKRGLPALYTAQLREFVKCHADTSLGILTDRLTEEVFPSTTHNTFSWLHELEELQTAFRALSQTVLVRALAVEMPENWIEPISYLNMEPLQEQNKDFKRQIEDAA